MRQHAKLHTFTLTYPPKHKCVLGRFVRLGKHFGLVRGIGCRGASLQVTLQVYAQPSVYQLAMAVWAPRGYARAA